MKNLENINEILLNFCVWSGAKELTSCRSRKLLKNAPTLLFSLWFFSILFRRLLPQAGPEKPIKIRKCRKKRIQNCSKSGLGNGHSADRMYSLYISSSLSIQFNFVFVLFSYFRARSSSSLAGLHVPSSHVAVSGFRKILLRSLSLSLATVAVHTEENGPPAEENGPPKV